MTKFEEKVEKLVKNGASYRDALTLAWHALGEADKEALTYEECLLVWNSGTRHDPGPPEVWETLKSKIKTFGECQFFLAVINDRQQIAEIWEIMEAISKKL